MLMMMTTIPSPHLMRTDTKRAIKQKKIRTHIVFCVQSHTDDDDRKWWQKGGKKRPLEEGYKQKNYQTGYKNHCPRLYLVHRLRRTRRLITSRGVICIRVHLLHHSRLRAGACGNRATSELRRSSSPVTTTLPLLGLFLFLSFKIGRRQKTFSLSSLLKLCGRGNKQQPLLAASIALSLR